MRDAARAAVARYGHLALAVAGRMGRRPGERRFSGQPQPSGIEVEAHAPYVPGDDLRHLDWSALGRLDTLVVRRFTAEREVVVHLLLDLSESMAVPAVDRKVAVAGELALAVASIALRSGFAVRLTLLTGTGPPRASRVQRRRTGLVELADLLAGASAQGALDLGAALGAFAHRHPEGGAAVLISDLLVEPASLQPGLRALARRGYALYLLQVLGAGDRDPRRALRSGELCDVESGARHALTLTSDVLARYATLLDDHQARLSETAAQLGALHAMLSTDEPLDGFVAGTLVRRGMVRPR